MKLLFGIVIGLLFVACSEPTEKKVAPEWNNQKSISLNKELATEQELDIDLYFAQHETLKYTKTGTGLRFVRLTETQGETTVAGMNVEVSQVVRLLNGKVVYQTASDEVDVFKIDNSELESGIHEGLKLMHVGEKARLVFPSHLAHGLIGDLKDIPPASPLVVDIELIAIEK
jgi:FKBP-type peptidyl-prolyl cis-trans isomerase